MNVDHKKIKEVVDSSIGLIGHTDWYSSIHQKRFADILGVIEKYRPDKKIKILEVGTWPGYLAVCFYRSGFDTAGIDIDPTRLEKIRRLGIEISPLDLNKAEGLPFEKDRFDFACVSEIVEHISRDSGSRLLSEVRRVLKPGGFLVLTTPNRYSFGNVYRFRFPKAGHCGADRRGHGHLQEFSQEEIVGIISSNGFKIIDKKRHNFYLNVGKIDSNRYFYPLSKLLENGNKLFNIIKIITIPIRMISILRDSIVIAAKNEK